MEFLKSNKVMFHSVILNTLYLTVSRRSCRWGEAMSLNCGYQRAVSLLLSGEHKHKPNYQHKF
jgi:hypothetical protein